MARRMLLGTVVVLAAASAWGADHSTPASCSAPLPAGAVELGTRERNGRTLLLRFEGQGVVQPDLAAFQAFAQCASRSDGDLTLRATAPVDAELFTQAVGRIAELVRLAVAEGQPNQRVAVEIATRADRQPIIEVQVSLTVPRPPEPVVVPTQVDPSKDPRLAWDRAQRYEERLAAAKAKEAQLRAAMTAREAAAEEVRAEQEERAARAKFEAHQRARVLAEQARRSEQQRQAALAVAARAEEKRKALEQRSVVREERVKKGQAERKAREERAKALDEAVARASAEERAQRAVVAKTDESWVQPITRRELVGLPSVESADEPPSPPRGRGSGRGAGRISATEPSATAEPTKTEEAETPSEAEATAPSEPTTTAEAKPQPQQSQPLPTEVSNTEPRKTAQPEKAAEAEPPTEDVPAELATTAPAETSSPTKTPEAEPKEPAEGVKTAEAEPVKRSAPAELSPTKTPEAEPKEPAERVKTAETAPVKTPTPAELSPTVQTDPLPRGGEGDKVAEDKEVKDALEPLKLAMLAYDEELKAKARKDQEAERAAAARQAALEERQAALAEKASKLNAAKLSAVGSEEKELARLERERLAEEKRLQAAANALAQKERKQAAEEARLAERARKLKERELTGRDEKTVDAARTARLELEAAAERSRKEQEALAAERLQADEQAMAAREARLTALSKRVELATVKSEVLLPGAAGRKQITTALGQTTKDIQRCVDAHLKRFPVAGKTQAVLALTVDLRGRVSGSSITGGPLKGSYLESCLHEAARAWRFPASDSELELEVPLTLVGH